MIRMEATINRATKKSGIKEEEASDMIKEDSDALKNAVRKEREELKAFAKEEERKAKAMNSVSWTVLGGGGVGFLLISAAFPPAAIVAVPCGIGLIGAYVISNHWAHVHMERAKDYMRRAKGKKAFGSSSDSIDWEGADLIQDA